MYAELEKSRKPDFPSHCLCSMKRVMGLPCGHDIAGFVHLSAPIPLRAVHRHWLFKPTLALPDSPDPIIPILDPLQISSRRQVSGTSTRRDRSEWEHVDEVLEEEQEVPRLRRPRKRKRQEVDDESDDDELLISQQQRESTLHFFFFKVIYLTIYRTVYSIDGNGPTGVRYSGWYDLIAY
jgi:hypothetical protein